MTGPAFVDANVIVYSRDTRDAEKQRRAEAWLRHLWDRGEGRLSAQVLHEYYVTVTRKLFAGSEPLSRGAAERAGLKRPTAARSRTSSASRRASGG